MEFTLFGKSPLTPAYRQAGLFTKEGHNSALWKREVRRDFSNRCCYYFEIVNKKLPGIR